MDYSCRSSSGGKRVGGWFIGAGGAGGVRASAKPQRRLPETSGGRKGGVGHARGQDSDACTGMGRERALSGFSRISGCGEAGDINERTQTSPRLSFHPFIKDWKWRTVQLGAAVSH